jgi:hypothetical protein
MFSGGVPPDAGRLAACTRLEQVHAKHVNDAYQAKGAGDGLATGCLAAAHLQQELDALGIQEGSFGKLLGCLLLLLLNRQSWHPHRNAATSPAPPAHIVHPWLKLSGLHSDLHQAAGGSPSEYAAAGVQPHARGGSEKDVANYRRQSRTLAWKPQLLQTYTPPLSSSVPAKQLVQRFAMPLLLSYVIERGNYGEHRMCRTTQAAGEDMKQGGLAQLYVTPRSTATVIRLN